MLINDEATRQVAETIGNALGVGFTLRNAAIANGAAHIEYPDGRALGFRPIFGGAIVQLWIIGIAKPAGEDHPPPSDCSKATATTRPYPSSTPRTTRQTSSSRSSPTTSCPPSSSSPTTWATAPGKTPSATHSPTPSLSRATEPAAPAKGRPVRRRLRRRPSTPPSALSRKNPPPRRIRPKGRGGRWRPKNRRRRRPDPAGPDVGHRPCPAPAEPTALATHEPSGIG